MPRKKVEKSSVAQRDKDTTKQYMVRRTGKYSKRGSKRKGYQKDIQNPKRSVTGYRNKESRYI